MHWTIPELCLWFASSYLASLLRNHGSRARGHRDPDRDGHGHARAAADAGGHMATAMPGASMPVAVAGCGSPYLPAPFTPADLQPPHEGVPNPNRMALNKKVFSGFCCFTVLVFIGFSIARAAGGCGCPAGYEISNGEESSCDCEGDIFNCEWKCYDACFKG